MDVLFKLMTLMQPKGVEEQDALLKQLTSPNPCRDPAAALRELKRWFTSVKRAVDIGMTLPSLELLYRGARSIYSGAFEVDDFALRLRWTNVEQMWGYPHTLSHEGLRAINDFAEAELTAMVISGQNGTTTGLPLTDTQRQRAKGEKEAEKKKKADERPPKEPQAAAVNVGGERFSNTHAMWAPPCTHWKDKGVCSRGIACLFRHEGFKMYENGKLVDRCFVCGRSGHPTKDCKAPGGGADPKKDEVWKAYKELAAQKRKESGGDGNTDAKGKRKGKGKGKKGKDKGQDKGAGKGDPQGQPPTASSIIVAAAVDRDGAFPPGAAGLDSWANVYLIHAKPQSNESWTEELRLADGSKSPCLTKIGKKGIPMAVVGINHDKDNIDLLPMGWLNERGCWIEWGEQVSITTPGPHHRRLVLGCWQGLPYLDAKQIEIMLNELPEAEEPGRSGATATTKVHASRAVLGPRACAITSLPSVSRESDDRRERTQEPEDKKTMLEHLDRDPKDLKKLKGKYRCMKMNMEQHPFPNRHCGRSPRSSRMATKSSPSGS